MVESYNHYSTFSYRPLSMFSLHLRVLQCLNPRPLHDSSSNGLAKTPVRLRGPREKVPWRLKESCFPFRKVEKVEIERICIAG